MVKLIIEGLMPDDQIRWKKIACKCDKTDIEKTFPLGDCKNCLFQSSEDSMPREIFKICFTLKDKKGKQETKTKIIKKIKINRGKKYQEILGWYNVMED